VIEVDYHSPPALAISSGVLLVASVVVLLYSFLAHFREPPPPHPGGHIRWLSLACVCATRTGAALAVSRAGGWF
jgi:hypothetical protein